VGDAVKDPAVYEDIFWSLLNSTEFLFNHWANHRAPLRRPPQARAVRGDREPRRRRPL